MKKLKISILIFICIMLLCGCSNSVDRSNNPYYEPPDYMDYIR